MNRDLRGLLDRLGEFGRSNDDAQSDRQRRMLNITPDTGEFLRSLVVSGRHQQVLELGTSNGYSTLWLADGARSVDGRVVSIEHNAAKHAMALENVGDAGLSAFVDLRLGEIGDLLATLRGFDLVFLDSERANYPGWWTNLQESVRPGGLIVVDNAVSHPEEMAPFKDLVEAAPGFVSVLVPIGKGELMILREL